MYSTESDILAEKNRGTARLVMGKKWDTSITNTKKYKKRIKKASVPLEPKSWSGGILYPFRLGLANKNKIQQVPTLLTVTCSLPSISAQAFKSTSIFRRKISFVPSLQPYSSWVERSVADTCGFIHDLCSFWFNNRYESLWQFTRYYEYIQAQYLLTWFPGRRVSQDLHIELQWLIWFEIPQTLGSHVGRSRKCPRSGWSCNERAPAPHHPGMLVIGFKYGLGHIRKNHG